MINKRKQPFWVAETVTRDPAFFLWRWWDIGRTQKYLNVAELRFIFLRTGEYDYIDTMVGYRKGSSHLSRIRV